MTDAFGNRIIIQIHGSAGLKNEPDIVEGPMWIGPVCELKNDGNPDHAPIKVRSTYEIVRKYLLQINPNQFKHLLNSLGKTGRHLFVDMHEEPHDG